MGLSSSLCSWVQSSLTDRIENCTSSSRTRNTGAPQGCVLSPLLYSLYTYDCMATHSSNIIVKFADDTVLKGLISNNNETAYLDEVEVLSAWCEDNNLDLNPLYLAPPTEEDWLEVAAGFQDRWDFPNCVGALDGKHVAIQAPPNSGSTFFNYKGGFSIVLMALVAHRYCFTVVEIGSHGSSSDGGIFRSSDLGKALQRGDLHLPGPRPLPGMEQPVPHVIVGDEAFPLQNNLIRLYPGRQLDEPRRIFNYRLSRARRVVENSFGILASKWEVYQRRIKLQPHNIDKVIKATCVLHNYLIKTLSPVNHPAPEARAEARAGGVEKLQPCGNHPLREAFNLREIYKDYFMSTGKVK
ncbi:hypothetical protein SKAU_G00138200 [Synaphobranchus kaupii]|uniref:Reverse transcriptase domain-containing protein n=1 Tax=Synaphobranchus kaupii TaxID=118154 RepID=A0A9Q1FS21_SYNKA|nr:hypothetical protein SKAU_G00138200 [Synaphobranchus kaupii]